MGQIQMQASTDAIEKAKVHLREIIVEYAGGHTMMIHLKCHDHQIQAMSFMCLGISQNSSGRYARSPQGGLPALEASAARSIRVSILRMESKYWSNFTLSDGLSLIYGLSTGVFDPAHSGPTAGRFHPQQADQTHERDRFPSSQALHRSPMRCMIHKAWRDHPPNRISVGSMPSTRLGIAVWRPIVLANRWSMDCPTRITF